MRTQLGLFHPGSSLLHRAPAEVKLALLAVAAAVTAWLHRPWQVGAALAVVLLLYAAARIPARVLLTQLRPLVWLVVVLGAFQAVVAGWREAVVVTGLLVTLVLLAALVTLTTRTTALVDAVVRMCRPLRRLGLDPDRVGLLLSLGIRSVPVVAGLATEVREAQLARGLGARPTAFAVPLVVRVLGHADALGDALAARGIDD